MRLEVPRCDVDGEEQPRLGEVEAVARSCVAGNVDSACDEQLGEVHGDRERRHHKHEAKCQHALDACMRRAELVDRGEEHDLDGAPTTVRASAAARSGSFGAPDSAPLPRPVRCRGPRQRPRPLQTTCPSGAGECAAPAQRRHVHVPPHSPSIRLPGLRCRPQQLQDLSPAARPPRRGPRALAEPSRRNRSAHGPPALLDSSPRRSHDGAPPRQRVTTAQSASRCCAADAVMGSTACA